MMIKELEKEKNEATVDKKKRDEMNNRTKCGKKDE